MPYELVDVITLEKTRQKKYDYIAESGKKVETLTRVEDLKTGRIYWYGEDRIKFDLNSNRGRALESYCENLTHRTGKSKKERLQRAYEMGWDFRKNGPNGVNCHFSLFDSKESSDAWAQGRDDATTGTRREVEN